MNTIMITTRNEISKLMVKAKIKVILILELLLCVVVSILGSSGSRLDILSFSISLPNLPITMLRMFDSFLIPLTIFMLVADVFCSEFENNTIKSVLLRPVSRLKIFISKNLAVAFFVMINLIFVMIVTIALKFIFKGTFDDIGSAIVAYLISIVPMMVFILMASLIAQLINNPSLMLFSCIILSVLLFAVKIIFSGIGAALFMSYACWFEMWIGAVLPLHVLLNTSLLLISYIFVFFIVGYLLFDSKEV